MAEFLFDHSVEFYVHGCTTNGEFDPEKAAVLGYSEAQYPAIEDILCRYFAASVQSTQPLEPLEADEDDQTELETE